MRISTSQIFDSGALGIQNNQSGLYKLQNQLSTGRRVLTPQDDPVAAAQALVLSQTKGVNEQYMENQGQAKSQLGLVDSQLSSLVNVLQGVRERVIQAGNTGTLSQSDRATIATELESRLSEMLGIANSDNGVGEYLFSGYRGNVRPFALNGATGSIDYSGDNGERLLQVSSSQQMAVSVAGSDVFMIAKEGNGSFVTGTGGNYGVGVSVGVKVPTSTAVADGGSVVNRALWSAALTDAGAGRPLEIVFEDNAGTMSYRINDPVGGLIPVPPAVPVAYTSGAAIPLVTAGGVDFSANVVVTGVPVAGDSFLINPGSGINQGTATVDAGSVLDAGKWSAAGNPGKFMVQFSTSTSAAGVVSTTYQLYDNTTPATPALLTTPQPFSAGQAIKLEKTTAPVADYGGQIVVQGQPSDGDTLTIEPSKNQSLFQTMQSLIGILRSPIGSSTYTATQFSNDLGAELTNLDQSFNNIARVQAQVGTKMQEIDSLGSASSDLDTQYQSTLSDLQDLDYAKAISDFMQQQMNLEAAQKSFAQISALSLFKYL